MFKKIKAALGYSATNKVIYKEAEYKLYEQVARDIAEGEKDEGVWTLAFAKSEGNSQKTEALYIELMVQKYKDEMDASTELLQKSKEEAKTENEKRKEEEIERNKKAEEFAEAREAEEKEIEREREKEKEKKIEKEIQKRKETETLIIKGTKAFSEPDNFNRGLTFIVFVTTSILIFGLIAIFLTANRPEKISYTATNFSEKEDLTYTEYNSVHDDTYWFVNEEAKLEGFYIGTVRSNLVWADRMSLFFHESDCGLEYPELFMILTTNKFTKKYPDFDYTSLENQSIEINMDFDGKYFEENTAIIEHIHDLENGNHAFQLKLKGAYNTFLGIDEKYPTLLGWQFLTLKVAENDPSRKYFDLPERQYRMRGFVPVVVSLIEQCKADVKAQ